MANHFTNQKSIIKEMDRSIWSRERWLSEHFLLYSNHFGLLSNNRNALLVLLVAGVALNRTVILPSYEVREKLAAPYMHGFSWEKATKVMDLMDSGIIKIVSSRESNPCTSIDTLIEFQGRGGLDAMRYNVSYENAMRISVPEKMVRTYDEFGDFRSNPIRLLAAFGERCLAVSSMFFYIPYNNPWKYMPATYRVIQKALRPSDQLAQFAKSYLDRTFQSRPFISIHMRLGDFCDPNDENDICVKKYGPAVSSLLQELSTGKICSNITTIFIMTNDRHHISIKNISQVYDIKFYDHEPSAPVVSGVRVLDITIIETEIASFGKCFIGCQESSLTHEVINRRVISRGFHVKSKSVVMYSSYD